MTSDLPGQPDGQIPARILNEHCYCPRLAYLMWVDGANADNAATLEGTALHRRVDANRSPLPQPQIEGADDRPRSVRSVTLGDEDLGIVAKIDIAELSGEAAIPIEYKRGAPASDEYPLHEPEFIQLMAQVLLLRTSGYRVDEAAVWFGGAKIRRRVAVPENVEDRVRRVVGEVRANAASGVAPPPLVDSPKCSHCVLIGLCLPDETRLLSGRGSAKPRRLVARDNPAHPLYVTDHGASVRKRAGRLVLQVEGEERDSVRLIDVSHVSVFGNATITSAALRACAEAGAPILWLSSGGWLTAIAGPVRGSDTRRRIAQHRAFALGGLEQSRGFVAGKIRNCRTLLRRSVGDEAADTVAGLLKIARSAEKGASVAELLGLEGAAGRLYFSSFPFMLKREVGEFDFEGRNRRPPRDPVNAMLSFAYAMLAKDALVALLTAGLDPYIGLYHQPGFARPSLALDLMEEFRPLIADSAVVRAINNGEIDNGDFLVSASGATLTSTGRKKLIAAYERRMKDELTHPHFGYKASYRRCMEIQARMLAANLVGELPQYRPLTTR
jgi:CRISP-associated protein Cas1